MTDVKKTIGQAIDEIVAALSAIDEKSRSTAITAACAHLGIESGVPHDSPNPHVHPVTTPGLQTATAQPQRVTDIRSLKTEKDPENAKEMACLVAYYLQNHAPVSERKETVTVGDMLKYFKQAGFPLPKRLAQLLVSARHSGYFDLAERGAYRLNAVGHNLIAHGLPRAAQGRK